MNYSEKELQQILVKLSSLMNTKVKNSITPDAKDLQFLAQIRTFMNGVSNNNAQKQNNRVSIQTQLRTFLKKGGSWEKLKTPIKNVSIIKVPLKKQKSARLHLVIKFMKREIDVKSSEVFHKLKEIFDDTRVNILIKEIDSVNSMKLRLPS